MAFQETDISWRILRRIVREWRGPAAELDEVKPLVGGCINTTLALHASDGARAVLKITAHRVNRQFLREAHQLRMLRELGLPAPKVLAVHIADLEEPNSYLLMEFVEGVNLAAARQLCGPAEFDAIQEHLAELVSALHAHTAPAYRREGDDDREQFDAWPDFYRHVYEPIWRDVERSPQIPGKLKKQIARVHERLDRLLAHDDCPRLTHWDIWSSNILVRPDSAGRWRVAALLDPNCKYAHAEAELAYMELFHTVTPAFLRAYRHTHHLGDGYHKLRKHIYQLYPLINHVHLFGHDYVRPLAAVVERVARLV